MNGAQINLRKWVIFLAGVAAVSVVAVLGLSIWTSLAASRSPLPAETFLRLEPAAGAPGTIVTVAGAGWQAGETVLVYLVEADSGRTDGVIYASAEADPSGQMEITFRYPQAGPWAEREIAIVTARGASSGREARTAWQVILPSVEPTTEPNTPSQEPTANTPTAQSPVPATNTPTTVPPTPTPTAVPPTATPTAVPATATAKPAATTSTAVLITEWRGEYYDNVHLIGSPLVRNDQKIDFDWGSGSPMQGIQADGFSVRWTRQLDFEAKTYRFYVRVDDGVRLWVDGQLLIDEWHDSSVRTYSAERAMTQGKHDLRVEMYERSGVATAAFWREKVESYPDWKGEYFANRKLSGSPLLTRNDKSINFNWGSGAPASGLPADNFGVRWTRKLKFATGSYRFSVEVDDGTRLWVDGTPVIDQWRDGVGSAYGDIYLNEGEHTVRMEMYEHVGGAMAVMGWVRQEGYPEWKGRYYANRELKGEPVLVRNDATIDFNWGAGAPAPGLPTDSFSVKWTRHMDFAAGIYRFCATADDGVSVEMDDALPYIIREWHDGASTYCNDVVVTAGRHKVTVEYFEHQGGALIQFWWQRLPDPLAPALLNGPPGVGTWPPPPPPIP